jgi:2-haloacid dehalogenase
MTQPLYVFDAYGTLFDVHSAVGRHRDLVGPQADRLSEIWRAKQLEYAWIRTLTGAHRGFWKLTQESLDYAAAMCGGISAEARAALLSAYETLDAYPDVKPTLQALKARGARCVLLSNGTPPMLSKAVKSADVADLLEESISVEAVGVYKTHPRAYELVEKRYGVKPKGAIFLSSNRWDIAGATKFGFRAIWVNRTHAPDEYAELAPAAVIPGLAPLLDLAV